MMTNADTTMTVEMKALVSKFESRCFAFKSDSNALVLMDDAVCEAASIRDAMFSFFTFSHVSFHLWEQLEQVYLSDIPSSQLLPW